MDSILINSPPRIMNKKPLFINDYRYRNNIEEIWDRVFSKQEKDKETRKNTWLYIITNWIAQIESKSLNFESVEYNSFLQKKALNGLKLFIIDNDAQIVKATSNLICLIARTSKQNILTNDNMLVSTLLHHVSLNNKLISQAIENSLNAIIKNVQSVAILREIKYEMENHPKSDFFFCKAASFLNIVLKEWEKSVLDKCHEEIHYIFTVLFTESNMASAKNSTRVAFKIYQNNHNLQYFKFLRNCSSDLRKKLFISSSEESKVFSGAPEKQSRCSTPISSRTPISSQSPLHAKRVHTNSILISTPPSSSRKNGSVPHNIITPPTSSRLQKFIEWKRLKEAEELKENSHPNAANIIFNNGMSVVSDKARVAEQLDIIPLGDGGGSEIANSKLNNSKRKGIQASPSISKMPIEKGIATNAPPSSPSTSNINKNNLNNDDISLFLAPPPPPSPSIDLIATPIYSKMNIKEESINQSIDEDDNSSSRSLASQLFVIEEEALSKEIAEIEKMDNIKESKNGEAQIEEKSVLECLYYMQREKKEEDETRSNDMIMDEVEEEKENVEEEIIIESPKEIKGSSEQEFYIQKEIIGSEVEGKSNIQEKSIGTETDLNPSTPTPEAEQLQDESPTFWKFYGLVSVSILAIFLLNFWLSSILIETSKIAIQSENQMEVSKVDTIVFPPINDPVLLSPFDISVSIIPPLLSVDDCLVSFPVNSEVQSRKLNFQKQSAIRLQIEKPVRITAILPRIVLTPILKKVDIALIPEIKTIGLSEILVSFPPSIEEHINVDVLNAFESQNESLTVYSEPIKTTIHLEAIILPTRSPLFDVDEPKVSSSSYFFYYVLTFFLVIGGGCFVIISKSGKHRHIVIDSSTSARMIPYKSKNIFDAVKEKAVEVEVVKEKVKLKIIKEKDAPVIRRSSRIRN